MKAEFGVAECQPQPKAQQQEAEAEIRSQLASVTDPSELMGNT